MERFRRDSHIYDWICEKGLIYTFNFQILREYCVAWGSSHRWAGIFLPSSHLVQIIQFTVNIVTPCSTGFGLLSRSLVGQCNRKREYNSGQTYSSQILRQVFIIIGRKFELNRLLMHEVIPHQITKIKCVYKTPFCKSNVVTATCFLIFVEVIRTAFLILDVSIHYISVCDSQEQ